MDRLRRELRRIDGRGYRAYKDLQRERYRFGAWELVIDAVQGDPFAAPSRVHLELLVSDSGHTLPTSSVGQRAFCDFLARSVAAELRRRGRQHAGSGRSGLVAIDGGGQEILDRTAVVVRGDLILVRLRVGLPAAGRRVLGQEAERLLCRRLPDVVRRSVPFDAVDPDALRRHIECAEDQDYLRGALAERALVAFVADGAVLPRASGVSDAPLRSGAVVAFASPPELRCEFELPSGGSVTGMGVPEGLTLIVGGGYHGKSTLLSCIERGIYDHIPGDGRELCVTVPTAMKIRAEDGRRVERVDISPFIDRLPLGRETRSFCTEDASGSTSQAAGIVEAVELGARVLLLDEDTCATNFLIRDARMQALVAREQEPITPLVDRVADLTGLLATSLILVLGGNGDYFEQADTVLLLDTYRPREVTARAAEVAARIPARRRREAEPLAGAPGPRVPLARGFDPRRGRRDVRIRAQGLREVQFGEQTIDLQALEQLVDPSQTRAIGDAIHLLAQRFVDGRRSLAECLALLEQELQRAGLDVLSGEQRDTWREYAAVRVLDVGAAINRLRSLVIAE